MQRRTVLVVMTAALCVVASPSPEAAEASSEPDQQEVNPARSPHFIQNSYRLEAIKRYILDRLNVSENRRFNRSASAVPPMTAHQRSRSSHDGDQHRRSGQPQPLVPTQSFSSLSEAMDFYAKNSAKNRTVEEDRERGATPVEDGVQRRRRRLNARVDEARGKDTRNRGASRRRSARRRGHRRQIKLTMTPDTGQNVPVVHHV